MALMLCPHRISIETSDNFLSENIPQIRKLFQRNKTELLWKTVETAEIHRVREKRFGLFLFFLLL